MLDVSRYTSMGAALRDALDQFAAQTCLIEAQRERENVRWTYGGFADRGESLAAWLQADGFAPDDRAAIIMTNQSKWLLSAYAVFHAGGVLVPLDYKLSADEHLALLAHCQPRLAVIEYHLWRAITAIEDYQPRVPATVLVTEAPPNADLHGARRWEEAVAPGSARFVERQRDDWACIVYSSGTGGRPKGCVLTHANYLEQIAALMSLYGMAPGDHCLSILPTNHAIDFMVGFLGSFCCGATVVHLRTLRPEYIREAFTRYRISYMAVVPMILYNLQKGLVERFAALPAWKRSLLNGAIGLNRILTRRGPNVPLSRRLLPAVHAAFGGRLTALFVGGAFTEPDTLRFFYNLGIPVANGYGLTEAGTALTLNSLRPFRADSVGQPLPGVELQIRDPDTDGIGEVAARSPTLMSHYLDDPQMTAETIVDGWLLTGDQGRIDADDHLQLFGRKKNMIVTAGGKNVYPEDIENAFAGLPVKEYCVFAANYLWPKAEKVREQLVIVLRLLPDTSDDAPPLTEAAQCNRALPDYKRISQYLVWQRDFPRTASMKIKRDALAAEVRQACDQPHGEVAA